MTENKDPEKKDYKQEDDDLMDSEREPYQLSISGVQFVFDSSSHYMRRLILIKCYVHTSMYQFMIGLLWTHMELPWSVMLITRFNSSLNVCICLMTVYHGSHRWHIFVSLLPENIKTHKQDTSLFYNVYHTKAYK